MYTLWMLYTVQYNYVESFVKLFIYLYFM